MRRRASCRCRPHGARCAAPPNRMTRLGFVLSCLSWPAFRCELSGLCVRSSWAAGIRSPPRSRPPSPSSSAAAEVRRAHLAAGDDALDGAEDLVVEIAVAEMVEHQRAGPDRADRVRDALAGDVGRRAVDRLEHRRDTSRVGLMFAPGAMPRLPEIAEPMSVRMSPNRFEATITSSVCGCVTIRAASASTWYLR